MGTHSAILRKREDGRYEGIYCHFDGYLSYNGRILKEYYSDPEKVKGLIALGDLSGLYPLLVPPEGTKHSYNKPAKDITIAYHRDRDEDLNITVGPTKESVIEQIDNGDNVYIFEDGKWTYNGDEY